MDENDIISTFWQEVFKKLPDAKAFGQSVQVRIVKGQTIGGPTISTKEGVVYGTRTTQNNPVHWLRGRGRMAVRNELNKLYRENLVMVCDGCGHTSVAKTTEVTTACVCGSSSTEEFWPSGNSSYGSKKSRRCKDCGLTWTRRFEKICHSCGSANIHIESKHEYKDKWEDDVPSDEDNATDILTKDEMTDELDYVIRQIQQALPKDPSNKGASTRKQDIFRLMYDPSVGSAICTACKASSKMVCSTKCDVFKDTGSCQCEKTYDPRQCCGSDTFSTDICVNYNKKLAEYFETSSSLNSRHIKKLRQAVIKRLSKLQHTDVGRNMYLWITRHPDIMKCMENEG